jgi:peptidoglycan/LPS O-acetylase OafA/YrhL
MDLFPVQTVMVYQSISGCRSGGVGNMATYNSGLSFELTAGSPLQGTIEHRQHIESLDGFRGIAILIVFFFHCYPRLPGDPIGLLVGGGWTGVDLFFVLSGFLITGILYDTLGQRRYFLNFYARRTLRLFPVYFVAVAIVLAVGPLAGLIYSWWDIPFLLYASNIVDDMRHHPQFGSLDMTHLWSLGVEEQFYCLWAPAIFLLRKRRRILIACICGAIFSFVLRWVIVSHPPMHYTIYRELPTRLDGLMGGAFLALVVRTERGVRWLESHKPALNGMVLGGVAVFCACIAVAHTSFYSPDVMSEFAYVGLAVLFSAAIALALQPGTWAAKLGRVGWLREIGKYSYGIYLFHEIPMKYYQQFAYWASGLTRFPMIGSVIGTTLAFAVTMGIAAVSYHTLELYFLRMKRFFAYDDERKAHRMNAEQDTNVAVS